MIIYILLPFYNLKEENSYNQVYLIIEENLKNLML
jgi:hypothetical protein